MLLVHKCNGREHLRFPFLAGKANKQTVHIKNIYYCTCASAVGEWWLAVLPSVLFVVSGVSPLGTTAVLVTQAR